MTETSVIKLSIMLTLVLTALGFYWGVRADSGMIILDGVFSLISTVLSLLTLFVVRQISSEDEDERFPFGKAQLEPLLIVFKSLALIGVCGFSAVQAVSDITDGGREVLVDEAISYGFIVSLICLGAYIVVHFYNRRLRSQLLKMEGNEWLGDFLLTFAVLCGFGLSRQLQTTELAWIMPYMDPAMVLLASSVFVLVPIRALVGALKEVVIYRVDDEILQPVLSEVEHIAQGLKATPRLRMAKVGRELDIELTFLVKHQDVPVRDLDAIRARIKAIAEQSGLGSWITVGVTEKDCWL